MSRENTESRHPKAPPPAAPTALTWVGRGVRVLLVLVILGAGGWVSHYWLTHRPAAKRRPPQFQAVLVEVARVAPQTHAVIVRAMGTVVPARTVQLASQVGGRVVTVSEDFLPGGRFKANERILRIEPRDYELAVQQRASELARAQGDLKVEMGQQSVARREYELLGREIKEGDRELVLREPQLATAQAAVAAAEASLEQANLDLARTAVVAPFNAMVQSRDVDLGAHVNVGTGLASLVGTDAYWVRVLVPVDDLGWIDIPGFNAQTGSEARVYHESAWDADAFREGKVERLMSELEPQGRMARLLVSVEDPLDLNSPSGQRRALILGSYVRVEISGRDLPDVIRVPRTALRDGNRVWVMQPDRTLDIRRVEVAWSGEDHVLVRQGLSDGDLLVTSDIGTPVDGMALRASDGGAAPPEGTPVPAGPPAPQAEGRP